MCRIRKQTARKPFFWHPVYLNISICRLLTVGSKASGVRALDAGGEAAVVGIRKLCCVKRQVNYCGIRYPRDLYPQNVFIRERFEHEAECG